MNTQHEITEKFAAICAIEENYPLSMLTTFEIGGPASLAIFPEDRKQLLNVLELIKSVKKPWIVIGRGSNLLVSDSGFDGIVLVLREGPKRMIKVDDEIWNFECGVLLSNAITHLAYEGYRGYEPLAGIPGTIGGAVIMNAGAYEVWFDDNLIEVEIWSPYNGIKTVKQEDFKVSYRHFRLCEYEIILSATLFFEPAKSKEVLANIEKYLQMRKHTQPLGEKCAGCIFKNPRNSHAGFLIEQADLKGSSIGDATISNAHSNFIINKGAASARDVWELIQIIRERIKKIFEIELELEIKLIGNFDV